MKKTRKSFAFLLYSIGKKCISFLSWLRSKYGHHTFKSGSQLGNNAIIDATARCSNLTGNKENIKIGINSNIKGRIEVQDNGKIHIGDYFYIGQNSVVGAVEKINIGNCVIISNDVRIYDNNNHPTSPKFREKMSMNGYSNDNWSWRWADRAPVVIEDNVWIGQYSSILKGVTIGKGSIVATRAVVTKDVPPYSIVAGNPAKVVKKIDNEG